MIKGWTRASFDSPQLKLGPPRFWQNSETIAEVEPVIHSWGLLSTLKRESFYPPYIFLGRIFSPRPRLSSILCQFERPGFCFSTYFQTSGLIKLIIWFLGALPEIVTVLRAVSKTSHQLPVSSTQKLLLRPVEKLISLAASELCLLLFRQPRNST